MVNLSTDQMRDSCLRTDRKWVVGLESTFEGVPDASFSNKTGSTVRVGKLSQNPAFQTRMQSLWGTVSMVMNRVLKSILRNGRFTNQVLFLVV